MRLVALALENASGTVGPSRAWSVAFLAVATRIAETASGKAPASPTVAVASPVTVQSEQTSSAAIFTMLSFDIWGTLALSGHRVADAVILALAFLGAIFAVPIAGTLLGTHDSLVSGLAVASGTVKVASSVRAVITGVVAVRTESSGLAPHEQLKFAEVSTFVFKIKAHDRFRLE